MSGRRSAKTAVYPSTVLITGGAGFLGRNLIQGLANRVDRIFVLDDLSGSGSDVETSVIVDWFSGFRNIEFIRKEVEDTSFLNTLPEIQAVVHLAAFAKVRSSFEQPELLSRNHIATTAMLEFIQNRSINHFVFASSSAVYGEGIGQGSVKNTSKSPSNPYAEEKILSEKAIDRIALSMPSLTAVSLRFYSLYGPYSRPDLFFPICYRDCINQDPVNIFGDSSLSRDFTYVGDAVSSIDAALKCETPGHFNIDAGSGVSTPVHKIVEIMGSILGTHVTCNYMDRFPGEPQNTIANNEIARDMLGMKDWTGVEAGMKLFVEWMQSLSEREQSIYGIGNLA